MLRYSNLIEALEAAPRERPFVTFWVDEDEQETVTFSEFRHRARLQAAALRAEGASCGDRVVIVMPQGIPAMTVFAGAMMLGAVPAFLAYPNEKVDPTKYRLGLTGVTSNLKAKLVVIDRDFPEEMIGCVSLDEGATLVRAADGREAGTGERAARRPRQRYILRLSSSIRRERPGCRKVSH